MIEFILIMELHSKYNSEPEFVKSRELNDGKFYVYHLTGRGILDAIFTEGLKPLNPRFRNRIDAFIDQFAPNGFSRTKAVFAHPDLDKTHRSVVFSALPPRVTIQVEVDPKMVFVTEMNLYSQVITAMTVKNQAEAERIAKAYWNEGMLLEDYLKLDQADSRHFYSPEALIPGVIPPDRLCLL